MAKAKASTVEITYPLLLTDNSDYTGIEPEIVNDSEGLIQWLDSLADSTGEDLDLLFEDDGFSVHELTVSSSGTIDKKKIELVLHRSFTKKL